MMPDVIRDVIYVMGSSLAVSILTKVSITTALALVGARLTRSHRAAERHVLLATALAVLWVLPIVSIVAPAVRIALPVRTPATIASLSLEAPTGEILSGGSIAAGTGAAPASKRLSGFSFSSLLLAGWIIGTMLFLLPVVMGTRQTGLLRRSGLPWRNGQTMLDRIMAEAGIYRHVDVLLHEDVPGPMTCGILHAAIMLPMDAKTWLEADLSRAIIHELEHVRRGDWLSQCLARVIGACYWFHPLVWIAQRQFALEAERACDDAVLQHAEATAYADQLVSLAQRLSATPKPSLLAMANRNDLATRVAAVLDDRQHRGRAGTFSLALACAVAFLLVTTISPLQIVTAQTAATAQSTAVPAWQTAAGGKISFEVASIHPSQPGAVAHANFPLSPDEAYSQTGGLMSVESFPLMTYITFAYKPSLTPEQRQSLLAQLPKWVATDRFTIQARAAGNPTKDQMRLMMQSLLTDRFKLTVHFETQQVPALALVLVTPGTLGPQLFPHADGPPCDATPPTDGSWFLTRCDVFALESGPDNMLTAGTRNNTMEQIAGSFNTSAFNLGRPVVDRTGLSGKFDFTIKWTPEPRGGDAPTDTQETTFMEALKDQLGLKLESTKAQMDVLFIDHVERPAEN